MSLSNFKDVKCKSELKRLAVHSPIGLALSYNELRADADKLAEAIETKVLPLAEQALKEYRDKYGGGE